MHPLHISILYILKWLCTVRTSKPNDAARWLRWTTLAVHWKMGHYLTRLLPWSTSSVRGTFRRHIKPLRSAFDWHGATMDAARKHNKGQLFHLTKATELKCVARDGWVLGESVWHRQRNLPGPKLIQCYFISCLSCFKGHGESSGKLSGGHGCSH